MKKSMLILTLMVAALCGCSAQQPTTLETPESSVLVEVTPETGSEATSTATPAPTSDPTPVPTAEPTATPTPHRSPDCGTYRFLPKLRGNRCTCAAGGGIAASFYELWCSSV